jgi:hypothetical protein
LSKQTYAQNLNSEGLIKKIYIYLTILKYFLSCALVIDHFYLEDAAEWIRSGAPWGVEVGASVISRNL